MTHNETSRRGVLKAGAAFGGLALLGKTAGSARAAEEITLVTWETYHDDEWLTEWSSKSGVKVNVIRIASNDETYAMLRSGAAQADLAVIDIGSMPRFIGADLLAPVDPSRVKNAGNVASGLKWPAGTTIDGKVWGVPYNWGTQPLMYNAEVLPTKPSSWKVFWDAKHAGKVVMPDDAYNVFPMIALSVGAKDPFNLTEKEFETCAQALRNLRPQLRTLARGFDDQTTIFASGDADVGYCQNISSVFQLQNQGKKIDYTFPDEGTPTWVDCAVLTATGAQRQVVYDLIDEMLTPRWQARFIQRSFNNGVLDDAAASGAGVPRDVLDKTNIPAMADPNFWKKMTFFRNPENVDRRLEMWNAFKAGTL